MKSNLYDNFPLDLTNESFSDIVRNEHVRIERIVSHGHKSEPDFWYQQEEHEWVLIIDGFGEVEYDDGRLFLLKKGDHLLIEKGQKHRVTATDESQPTIWLAVFFK